jgi:hypothetical protein
MSDVSNAKIAEIRRIEGFAKLSNEEIKSLMQFLTELAKLEIKIKSV